MAPHEVADQDRRAQPNPTNEPPNSVRRRLLSALAAGGIAGCLGDGTDEGPQASPATTSTETSQSIDEFETVDTTAAGGASFERSGETYSITATGLFAHNVEGYGAIYLADRLETGQAVEVTVESQEDTRDWAKAGLLLSRDITAAGDAAGDVAALVTPGHGFLMQRDADGDGYMDGEAEPTGETSYPATLRLERGGSKITGFYSTDGGDTFSKIGTVVVSDPDETMDVGMVQTSGNDRHGTTTFSGFEITSLASTDIETTVPDATATPEGPIDLEGPFPETERAIATYREQRLAEHYEKHGDPDPEAAIQISSLEELAEYAQKNDVHVRMEPGTYAITVENYDDLISVARGPNGGMRANYLHFSGHRSYWDLRGVTITAETRILNRYEEALSRRAHSMEEVFVTAQDSIIRGLEYENVDRPEWVRRGTRIAGARTFNNYGANNLFHDITVTGRGSWPYGYGSMFGFSRNDTTLPMYKKSAWGGGGYANLYVGIEVYQRAFGHALAFRDVRKLEFIDCHIEGELRQTDDILAEESGPAYENDFPARYGNRLRPGAMISLCEDAFRTYGEVATAKILGCSVAKVREPFKFRGNSENVFIAQTTFTEHADKGPLVWGNVTMEGCAADFKYAPALALGTEDVSIDMTLLPSPTADSITRHRWVKSEWKKAAAYINGSNNEITFHAGADDLGTGGEYVPIVIGFGGGEATNIQLVNQTELPVVLQPDATECTIESVGPVDDRGTNNVIQSL